MRFHLTFLITILLVSPLTHATESRPGLIDWQDWSAEIFDRAEAEGKYVLLDLEAVWCHWCHVMDEKTYAHPDVARFINEHYLAVKVDQDARPDLSNRYEIFGWPATVVFAADGTEIVKLRGYKPPGPMLSILQAILDDPTPVDYGIPNPDTFSTASNLSNALRDELEQRHLTKYDSDKGGFPVDQKFLIPDSIEYTLLLAAKGDKQQEQRARQTLNAALNLLDPIWGGFYQYSTHGDWQHQHFEKIMSVQAGYLRAYAMAYAVLDEPRYLDTAKAIVDYVDNFLTSPDGAFYTSQDADVTKGEHSDDYFKLDNEQRLALGIPAVDKHIYARENGWMIEALALLYEVTGDQHYLNKASNAINWLEKNRALAAGGYSHDAQDTAGPYLGDTLAVGRAYLQLYRATSQQLWLKRAVKSAQFISHRFLPFSDNGLISAIPDASPIAPAAKVDENIDFVRFANLLQHYAGITDLQPAIDHAMRLLATAELHKFRLSGAGILMADDELRRDPLHLTIVGSKLDPNAAKLYEQALRYPGWYKRVEWLDRETGGLINMDVQYPKLDNAAAFICTENRCSLPVFTPATLTDKIMLINSG